MSSFCDLFALLRIDAVRPGWTRGPPAGADRRRWSSACRERRAASSDRASSCCINVRRAFQRRAGRQLDRDFELALVVLRQEVLADHHEQRDGGQNNQQRQTRRSPSGASSTTRASAGTAPRSRRKKPDSLVSCLRASDGRRKRAHSIGVSVKLTSSDTMIGERRRVAEARHELADDAAHHRHRQEDDHEAERRREHRQADVARAHASPLPSASASFLP